MFNCPSCEYADEEQVAVILGGRTNAGIDQYSAEVRIYKHYTVLYSVYCEYIFRFLLVLFCHTVRIPG